MHEEIWIESGDSFPPNQMLIAKVWKSVKKLHSVEWHKEILYKNVKKLKSIKLCKRMFGKQIFNSFNTSSTSH